MSDFYIVPPRLIVGSLDRSNVVTSLNTLRGDLSFKVNPETGLTLNIASGIFTFSILPDFYVKKSGDTINSNIIFQPSSGNYGLAVGSGTSDPNTGIAGALFYNTNSDVLKVYDGSTWNEIASTGTTGITVSFADNRYLRLDGTNTPTGHISMGSQFLRFANLTTRALAGTAGQVYFNTDTNRLDLYDGSSWVPVGTGITGIFAGAGASVSPNPITNTGTVSVNQSYNFNWTGTHTHNNPITFAPNQQFDASKLTIAYEVAGDILTFSGTAWTRLGKGGPNTLLGVHCCGGDLEYKTLVAGAGILISYQGSSIFLASTGGTGTGSGGSGGSGTGYTFYDKGDLLVGLGDSLYKLPVGPNKRFYLHSNSDTVSGVAWTTTVGMAITSIAPSALVSYYGDLWYNTADGTLNVFYNDVDTSQWVEVVSGGAFSQVYQGVNYGIPFYVSSGTAITSNNNFTNVGSGVTLLYTTQSISPNSGALVVSGGVGIGGSVFIGGAAQIQDTTNVSDLGWQSLVGSFGILSTDFRALAGEVTVGSLVNYGGFANVGNAFIGGTTTITNNTPSFSYDTGALVVYGGVGIGGTLFVSPNKASSVSGVKLFNGVVSQATWQGNIIQYTYGGTGYSIFSKGDILVGTGTSLLKLSVGSDNQVLSADSTSATGLTWTTVASSGFATIGITSLNGISLGQQYLNATYSGNNFGFTSSGSTHTLNIPIAGTSTTGLVSTGSQTFSGSKTFSSDTHISSSTDANNISSGALVVDGGAGFAKSVYIGGTLDVAGDMYIRGTMTTINTVNLTVDDKNIEIGAVDTPTDITAEGGGITLKGTTDKTIAWNSGIGWSFNNPVNLSDGNTFKIGNTTVISSSGLGSSVFYSSLTSVGTLTTGTWNASTISSRYGGTGYTNYAKGDLLVGTGSSLLILPVGSNTQILTVDSTAATGLTWSNNTATGTTTIGIPGDNTYTDGFFSTWTSSTPISNAFDDINELLALLAPARPSYLTGTSLSASSVPSYYTVKISAGLGTEWYQAGYGTGTQITRYYLSGAHTLNTANTSTTFSAGSLTTSTYGTIYFSRYNYLAPTGGGVGTIDLTTNYTVGYTNNNLKLTALGTYNSIWTKANAQILTYTQPNPGYEGVYISHTENSQLTNTYEMWKDPWSASNGSPSFSQSATASTYSQTDKWLSGISYYSTGTGFSIYFKGAAGIYSCAYNVTQVYGISGTGLITSTGLPSSPPLYTDELDKSGSNHVRVSLSSASQSSFNKYLTVTIYKAHGTTSTSNATLSKAINTYGTVSTDTYEGFQDEARRLVIGSGIAFTSTLEMANGNAQVRSGTLQYPLAADYDTQWGGSHTFTGDQEYQRYFYKTSASTGTLTFTGFTASNIAPYGTGNINVLLYLDGDALWFDLGVLQGSNSNDGSTRSAAISAKTSASGGALGWSIGTKTTGVAGSGNSARYRVVIIYKNNTYNMTSITSS